mmetsp:Transcript_65796/g.165843  ORF Transcript_65796/g.165843 Transcript_65796/m.165843 type:complete len:210 (+) Transcript_65796:1262-1891(+)
MDLPARHLEVAVPPGGPADVAVGPPDIVCVEDLVLAVQIECRGAFFACLLFGFCCTAPRLNLKSDNTVAFILFRILMVLDVQRDMVVDVVPAVLCESDKEAVHIGKLTTKPAIPGRCWKVVQNPIHQILVLDHAPELVLLCIVKRDFAKLLASFIDPHFDLVRGVLNQIAHQGLTQVLHAVLNLRRLTIRQGVIRVRQLRLDRGQLVHL